ncbi:MAG: AAA family ATPase [Ilumatobacteraceae bacterium]
MDDVVGVAEVSEAVVTSLGDVVAGQEQVIRTAVCCLLSGGHLLIEDIPGVGKTLLAQALASSVGGTFHRIQGTPDLLPGDVVGSLVPDGGNFEFRFRPGPIFAHVVVFDELNRASPRTQSALLEATEEAAVTVDGTTRPLPDPFLLVATQNPFEMIGTSQLGEGMLDRFAAVVTPGRASSDHEIEVLTGRRGRDRLAVVRPVVYPAEIVRARRIVGRVEVSDVLAGYVVAVLDATRAHPEVRLGASTRAGVSLIGLARARAAMDGRRFVLPDDVRALAVDALAHRVAVRSASGSVDAGRKVVAECIERVPVPSV